MENGDNILQRLREILGNNAENITILEHQVEIKVQMEYYELSNSLGSISNPEIILQREPELYESAPELESRKELLVSLSRVEKPEAFRILQKYLPHAQPELKEWAIMAFQESRMLLETRLLDEHKVFISTGLGGKDDKLRYFVVLLPLMDQGFSHTEKKVIESEINFAVNRYQGVVEAIHFLNHYAKIMALIPLDVPVKQPFQQAIEECNALKPFVKGEFIITNVKALDNKEIKDIIQYRNDDNDLE